MSEWFFREKQPDEKSREAVQEEFFSNDSLENETQSLIREAIQNSLDARLNSNQPVKVRLYLGDLNDMSPWISDDAWNHFNAPNNGLRNIPEIDELCPFLLVEDFNTTGLNGDIQQYSSSQSENKNAFYHFLRAEGQSDKTGNSRGRWGIGKIVFPRSSRLRTFFILTKRSEDEQLLLAGQSILKYHLLNGKHFTPDGWFGKKDELNPLCLPLDDIDLINSFNTTFKLKRKDETGTSIIIPWCNPDITYQCLAKEVISEYFYPILKGDLEVTIESESNSMSLTANTLNDETDNITDEAIAKLVLLATESLTIPEKEFVKLKEYKTPGPSWQIEMLEELVSEGIREKLEAGAPVGIKVPLTIQKQDSSSQNTHIKLIIKKDESYSKKTTFIRENIVISDIRAPATRGYMSLVIIDDEPLATLLGDAENPAHTNWNQSSSHFKNKYKYGDKYLAFVRQSVSKVIQLTSKDDKKPDYNALLNFFSIPNPENENIAPKANKKNNGKKVFSESTKIPETKKQYYKLDKNESGFNLKGSNTELTTPRIFKVKVAYDVVRGNPFKKWNKEDFSFEKKLDIEIKEVTNIEYINNTLSFKAVNNDFIFSVKGFDTNRDLKIDVKSSGI